MSEEDDLIGCETKVDIYLDCVRIYIKQADHHFEYIMDLMEYEGFAQDEFNDYMFDKFEESLGGLN